MRIWPALTVLMLAGPALAGLAGTVLPALGHFPAAGLTGPSPDPFVRLFATPGIWRASALSVGTGIAATTLSLAITILLVAGWSGTRVFARVQRALSPLLSIPHAAVGFGLAMLIAPSGWLVRIASPWATGWTRPPDALILNDPWGIAMTAGLVVKEVPFLLLMTLAALPQAPRARALAASLGYGPVTGWLKTTLPAIYAQIRLPVYAVLAFSMSVVDLAIILGPSTPPPLSVLITRWMGEPDLAQRTLAAAGALWQLVLTLCVLALWRAGEVLLARLGRRWIWSGTRRAGDGLLRGAGLGLAGVCAGLVFAGLVALALWSVSGGWRFPQALPDAWDARGWTRIPARAISDTALIAALATGIAALLTIGSLASGKRIPPALIYLPLIVPQTVFLPGMQILALHLGADRGVPPVLLAHLTFVLPYVLLSLSGPWRAWDTRMATVGASLGATPARVLWRLRLPMLLTPILTACAVGIAVSVGQYLPTLLMGGGRVATLTTEAVALASGADRRVIGATALAQTAAALIPFAIALALPALIWRNRKGMTHG